MSELYNLTQADIEQLLPASAVGSYEEILEDLITIEDNAHSAPIVADKQPDFEEVSQTGMCIETSPFAGDNNFRVHIQDIGSKQYTYSKDLNRLYCHMDRAVPITFKWEGSKVSRIRAMLMFKDPDNINKPVFRCRTHNDEKVVNNVGCKFYKHILRCDNENVSYMENKSSGRHSVVRLLGTQHCGSDGVAGHYRFMCYTTCNGVDAIARRRTDLILTSEDINGCVLGRVVLEVKICACPLRDKNRDEADGGSKKKRKSDGDYDFKKILKREDTNLTNVALSPTINVPVENVASSMGDPNESHVVKREIEGEATSDFTEIQVGKERVVIFPERGTELTFFLRNVNGA